MTTPKEPPKAVQEIFKNVQAGGNITTGDITQIYQIIVNLQNLPKPTGFPQNIPESSTNKFVGRQTELEQLHQQLLCHNQVVIAAIEGMAGVGKTELAIQYCLLHLQLHTYTGGVCWLRAREQDVGLQIVQFARTDLGLQPPEDLDISLQVRWCWNHWREGTVLVVLDDVKNYPKIKDYLPPQPSRFKVLITTRLKLDLAGSLFLEVLLESEAVQLLAQLIGEEKVSQELIKAQELVQRLGYLPLALQLVGVYVKRRKISLTEMLRRLEEKGLEHGSLLVKSNDPTWTSNIQRGVAAAFELSWEELSESAQQLGCLLSLFALAPITWSLVEQTVFDKQEKEKIEDAIVELENWHLLQGKETYQLHQLIREFLRNKQNNLAIADKQKHNFCQGMKKEARKINHNLILEEVTAIAPIIPHLAEIATNLKEWLSDLDLFYPFICLGHFYSSQGLYNQAVYWNKQCLSVTRSRLGDNHPCVAISLNNLALLYKSQGRYELAEPLYLQSIELSKKLLGNDHLDVAINLNNLAELYRNQGRYELAEPLFIQSLELKIKLLGDDHPSIATSLNNFALFYRSQGRYELAESFLIQSLELCKKLLGDDHPYVASSLNNLAEIYHIQGRYELAEPLFIQSLELKIKLLGDDHPSIATSLNNLAIFYHSQGGYELAEPLYLHSLELCKKLLGDDHPYVAANLNNLALLYKSQGRYELAESLSIQSLELSKKLLGDNHPDVATNLNNLAELYRNQGRYELAEPLYFQSLEILNRQLGEQHPNTKKIRDNLKLLQEEMRGRKDV